MELRLDLPEEIFQAAGLAGKDFAQKAKLLLMLELYREGHLSFGKLSELSGLSQMELLEQMQTHATYLNYSSEDLAQDQQAVR